MATYFNTNANRQPPRLSITSLMDVLTIILIFLLTNYSEEAPEADISNEVKLPIIEAKSEKIPSVYKKEIKITFGMDQLEIGEEVISYKNFEAQEQQVMQALIQRLKEVMEEFTEKEKMGSVITLHADKDVSYIMIESLMKSAALAGITQVEFIGMHEQK